MIKVAILRIWGRVYQRWCEVTIIAKAGAKCAPGCFSMKEKIRPPDQLPVVPRVGWYDMGWQNLTSRFTFTKASKPGDRLG
jgi:hypothetical protein